MTDKQNRKKTWIIFASILAFSLTIAVALLSASVRADPANPELEYHSNSTKPSPGAASRADQGGYITTVNFTSTQQNTNWKAYVGNVTGLLTLDDASNNTIYDWTFATIAGEIFASRSSSITWANIDCANTTIVSTENSVLGFDQQAIDTINATFNETTHQGFIVAGQSITQSNCPSTAPYVSDARQTVSLGMNFQEVLLDDNTNLVYTARITADSTGFDDQTYDFQMIVADNASSTQDTTYYFFIELG